MATIRIAATQVAATPKKVPALLSCDLNTIECNKLNLGRMKVALVRTEPEVTLWSARVF